MGLGSPKVDKVLNTKKEDLIIPEEWLKIIQKPDGSWKKIIFYNTSITALLKYGNKILDKMRGVFKTFKENKDEVALLWRPHPLIRATVASMRPQLWDEYNKMVAQYKEEGWGIYDDTADMDRAVVLSDAYYGDGSSVVQLCLKAGKQVVLQNICYRNESGKTVCIEDGVMVEEVFWFVVSEVGALFSYNFTNFGRHQRGILANDLIIGVIGFKTYGFNTHIHDTDPSYYSEKLGIHSNFLSFLFNEVRKQLKEMKKS